MKLLGLDIGDRRIGIAFGDSDVHLATPVDVIERASVEEDARAIAAFVKKFDATGLIAGLPRNMDGTRGAQAESVRAYAEKIAVEMNMPVIFWDEQLTTVEATERVHASGAPAQRAQGPRRRKKSRRGLDAIAASVILQDYMDSQSP